MMTKIAAFAVLSLIVTVTPGPDSLLVLRSSLLPGRRTGARVAGGATSGSLAWGICSAVGLPAILAASAQLYRALQLAGVSTPEQQSARARRPTPHTRPGPYRAVHRGWDRYLASLREYVEAGHGTPRGSSAEKLVACSDPAATE